MSNERVYAVIEYEPEDGPPHHAVHQVVLRLLDDHTFFLLDARYSNDWGTKTEHSARYSGSYTEEDGHVICHATLCKRVERDYDHDWGKGHNKRSRDKVDETFSFPRVGADTLTCTLESFHGRPLSATVEPHGGVF